MNLKQVKYYKVFITAYDGEDDSDSEESGNESFKKTEGKETEQDDSKTFTQDQLEEILKKRLERERETSRKKNNELINQLQDLEQKASMTSEEREKLQRKIEEMRSENLSVEEKAQREKKTLEEQLVLTKKQLEKTETEWKGRYNSFRVQKELQDAALTNDAAFPDQLVRMLIPDTKVVERLDDDGNPTGDYEVKTAITIFKGDNREPASIELSPREAVAKLKDMPDQWGNQFKSQAQGGMGYSNDASKGSGTEEMPLENYEEYVKWRAKEKNRKILGIKE